MAQDKFTVESRFIGKIRLSKGGKDISLTTNQFFELLVNQMNDLQVENAELKKRIGKVHDNEVNNRYVPPVPFRGHF